MVAKKEFMKKKELAEIKKAVEILKRGGIMVFPTETSYGLGCDATNARTARHVFEIKGRLRGKGTPLLVSSLAMAKRYGVFSRTAVKVAQKYWPGPVTIIVPAKKTSGVRVASICQEGGTLALRLSSHPIARSLVAGLGRPLVATSANRSGEPPSYSIPSFLRQFKDGTSLSDVFLLNVGRLPRRRPSVLVKIIGNRINTLRSGDQAVVV